MSANSGERFSAYHAWTINPPPFKLRSAYLIVFADVAAKSASDASTFYTPFDELTYLISHELIEAVTDPFVPFGWNDMSGGLLDVFLEGEMADIAAKTPSPDKRMVWYNGMVVAGYWSNRHKDVVAGSGVARRLTFKANFVSERNPPNVSVPVKIDTRTAKLLPANVFTFDLLVVDGTTHSYEYPQDVGDPSTGTTYYAYVPTNKRQGRVERDLNIAVDYTTLHYVEVTTKPAAVAERADIALTESGWKDAGPQQLTAPRTVRIGGVTYRFLEWRSVSGPVVRATTPNVNYNLTGPLKVMAIYVRR